VVAAAAKQLNFHSQRINRRNLRNRPPATTTTTTTTTTTVTTATTTTRDKRRSLGTSDPKGIYSIYHLFIPLAMQTHLFSSSPSPPPSRGRNSTGGNPIIRNLEKDKISHTFLDYALSQITLGTLLYDLN